MNLSIIGTGGVALATAARLHQMGHSTIFVSLSGNGGKSFTTGRVSAIGAIETDFPAHLATSTENALGQTDHVIVATSADRYSTALHAMLPHLEDRHNILVSGELSQFSGVLISECRKLGKSPSITSLATTLVTGRRGKGADVRIGLIRSEVLAYAAALNHQHNNIELWNSIFGGCLVECKSASRILLSNLNPIVHAPNALCNFTRIEKGEDWSNFGGITSGVANLLIALDEERIRIGKALGQDLISFKENFERANGFAPKMSLDAMAHNLCTRRNGLPKGPSDPTTRYVTEDVPFGLVVNERLGRLTQVETPISSAIITVFSTLYQRNFRSDNPFLELLDITT